MRSLAQAERAPQASVQEAHLRHGRDKVRPNEGAERRGEIQAHVGAQRAQGGITAGAVAASAPTEEQYRMFKGFFDLDSRKTIFKILGDATARLPIDEFKRIDPAKGMAVCRIVIAHVTTTLSVGS